MCSISLHYSYSRPSVRLSRLTSARIAYTTCALATSRAPQHTRIARCSSRASSCITPLFTPLHLVSNPRSILVTEGESAVSSRPPTRSASRSDIRRCAQGATSVAALKARHPSLHPTHDHRSPHRHRSRRRHLIRVSVRVLYACHARHISFFLSSSILLFRYSLSLRHIDFIRYSASTCERSHCSLIKLIEPIHYHYC